MTLFHDEPGQPKSRDLHPWFCVNMANTSSAAGAGTATGQDADISPVNPSLIPQDAPDLLVIVVSLV